VLSRLLVTSDTPDRAHSFGSVAHQYNAARPSLPLEINTTLGLSRSAHVVEIAAGTGLATRTLVQSGAHVIAVEPDDDMRTVLQAESPSVDARSGSGEDLPVDDAWADVVVIVNAWHWVDTERGTREAARVLRDGGSFAVVKNGLDDNNPTLTQLRDLRRASRGATHQRSRWMSTSLRETLPESSAAADLFDDAVTTAFHWTWPRTIEQIVELMGTFSGVITASADDQRQIAADTARLAAELADDQGVVAVPMLTWSIVSTRRHR
jgi:SAM-dependent methyltransferase